MGIPVIDQIKDLKRGLILNNATPVNEATYLKASAALLAAKWLAGAPLAFDGNELKMATVGNGGVCDIRYIAARSYYDVAEAVERINNGDVAGIDANYGKQLYVLAGNFVCEMYGDSVDGVAAITYPFLQTPTSGTWVKGAKVFLTAAGLWDDTAIAAEKEYGHVEEVFGDPTNATGLRIRFDATVQK